MKFDESYRTGNTAIGNMLDMTSRLPKRYIVNKRCHYCVHDKYPEGKIVTLLFIGWGMSLSMIGPFF